MIRETLRSTTSTTSYFDPSSFAIATPGTFGNNRRNSFHGPGLNNFDMAIMKNVYFLPSRETMYLQMRLEAYNVFNHTQFCNTAGPFPVSMAMWRVVPSVKCRV